MLGYAAKITATSGVEGITKTSESLIMVEYNSLPIGKY